MNTIDNSRPTTIVIFGASGDLTKRKLIPALFSLYLKGRLPDNFRVVGFAWTDWDSAAFREQMKGAVDEFVDDKFSADDWTTFNDQLGYVCGSFTDQNDYEKLNSFLKESENQPSHRLYYLATAPKFFAEIIDRLGEADMTQEDTADDSPWRRVIIEKPFGRDLKSAQALNQKVHATLAEHQIYRIDHYLAKETVQNILVFRFANTMFEPIWNRNYIDHVQITAAESVEVGHRGAYYDQAGVLRDMFQNHIMQLLALVSMEPPASFKANAIRNEKVKALEAIRPLSPDQIGQHTILAQHDDYTQVDGVSNHSRTPTFAALELYIDNWRWRGVPFYLRSGKAMAKKVTEIIVQFKQPPHMMFPMSEGQEIRSNYLALCLQPHEGVHQRFEVKVPDTEIEMRSVDMDFHYEEAFHQDSIPEAYETLLLNALEGDVTLFTRADGIEAAWRVIDPILQAWEVDEQLELSRYASGSWGPETADDLLKKSGRAWRHGCVHEN